MSKLFILLFLPISMACTGFGGPQEGEHYQVVSADSYSEFVNNDDIQLIDVRTAEEYASGRLPGAKNYDYLKGEVESLITELDKSKPVYVYCRSGKRSAASAQILIEAGFESVIDLNGGFLAWSQAKLPIELNNSECLNC